MLDIENIILEQKISINNQLLRYFFYRNILAKVMSLLRLVIDRSDVSWPKFYLESKKGLKDNGNNQINLCDYIHKELEKE